MWTLTKGTGNAQKIPELNMHHRNFYFVWPPHRFIVIGVLIELRPQIDQEFMQDAVESDCQIKFEISEMN